MPGEWSLMGGRNRVVPAVVTLLFAWVLWHDLSVHRAVGLSRVAGPTYAVGSHDTRAACEVEQHAAMAREALPRTGPSTEPLADGIKVWDPDLRHYTTFRYLCWPAGAGPAPFR